MWFTDATRFELLDMGSYATQTLKRQLVGGKLIEQLDLPRFHLLERAWSCPDATL